MGQTYNSFVASKLEREKLTQSPNMVVRPAEIDLSVKIKMPIQFVSMKQDLSHAQVRIIITDTVDIAA